MNSKISNISILQYPVRELSSRKKGGQTDNENIPDKNDQRSASERSAPLLLRIRDCRGLRTGKHRNGCRSRIRSGR
jgi:hypothetical protein